jgi:glycosyltransferase involved in cell wall biosynthesis
MLDLEMAAQLGIDQEVHYATSIVSRNFMPYLVAACDIYAAPSRLEGFGMPQVEANACGRPVIGLQAMGMLDTLVDGETAFLAGVATENRIGEAVLGMESGYAEEQRIVFDPPRIADYRASVSDIARALLKLMNDPELRRKMGEAGRRRVVERFDYRRVAKKFMQIVTERLGIS